MNSLTTRDGHNSRSSLPLPSSLTATPTTPTTPVQPSIPPTRLPTAPSTPTNSHFHLQPLHSPPNLPSSTHAGGIQPSSLFFRPARPAQQQQYSPQPSLRNAEQDTGDNYPLAPLHSSTHLQEQRRHSLGNDSLDNHDPQTDTKEDTFSHQFSTGRSKQSHELLLPTGGPSHTRKPSVLSINTASPKKSAVGRVRTSLDRVFGLSFSNRLSIDSIRNHHNYAFDEEQAVTPTKSHHHHESPMRFDSRRTPRAHSPTPSHLSSASARASTPTRTPSFIAIPPTPSSDSKYPLSRTPRLEPGSSKPIRNFALHPSRNHFFLSGRLLTGGDTPVAFIASLSLLFGLAGLWFGTTCVFWWHHSNGSKAIVIIGAYLAALVLSTMLTTATADPGILPRGLDPDPPYPSTSPSDGGVSGPMPRDLSVRTEIVRVKYCPTCKTYRPPRSSHCKMCDNCVDGCDHHCQWVNNCIGRRNYTTFFALLCAVTTTLILIIITTTLHLWLLTTIPNSLGNTPNFRHALGDRKGAGSAVAFCLSMIVIWPVGALLTYHARLLLLNVTTIEMIRNQAHKAVAPQGVLKPPNPFSHGTWRRNVAAVLCRPRGYSWLQAHEVATEDLREVNPGMRGAANARSG